MPRRPLGHLAAVALRQGRRGQSAVELALMMPLLALILLGATDLGRAFFYYTRLTNSVSAGAIYGISYPGSPEAGKCASLCGDPDNVKYHVTNEASLGL